MKCKCWIVLLVALLPLSHCLSQIGIGQWRDHLSFNTLYGVQVSPNRIYAVGKMGLFYLDRTDSTLHKWSKGAPLTDVGVATFAYDPLSTYAIVAYSNANVDIIYHDKVYNLSDIKRSEIPNKSIHNITFHEGKAYLACDFGVVVVDLDRKEIAETYYLGEEGTSIPIYDLLFTDSLIVAATDNGLLHASINERYLHIIDHWQHDTSWLSGMKVTDLDYAHGILVALASTENGLPTLYRQSPSGVFTQWAFGNIKKVHPTATGWLIVQDGLVYLYDSNFVLQQQVDDVDWLNIEVNDAALADDGTLWLAHTWASLVSLSKEGTPNSYAPLNPPSNDNVYKLVAANSKMLVCPGGKRTTYDNLYIHGNLFVYQKEQWSSITRYIPDYYADAVDVAVDPTDSTHWVVAAWGYGVVDIRNNVVQAIYSDTNTGGVLADYGVDGYRSIRTGGVAFDYEGNVWITNSMQRNGLVRFGKDSTWTAFNTSSVVTGEIDKIIYDSIYGYKWFAGKGNRLYIHDGESKIVYVDPNHGSKMETHTVNCFVQDHNGDIWIGTNKGIKVIRDAYNAFKNGGRGEMAPITSSNILFTQNGIAEYLMAYETVTAITVDGANRKWIGTANGGLYLISANGQEQLEHFTAANSPLFSDKIVTLAVLPKSGELFIGTDKGLQSYRGTATYATARPERNITVFPNPVRPDYEGPIAIKGFSRNALVHVTDAAGHVLFSTTSNGGQAVWNGCTASGERVASGVYFVFASDENGKMKTVGKVLVVR